MKNKYNLNKKNKRNNMKKMNTLTLENVKNWEYTDEIGLDVMENLHKKHDEYEALENSCQEGILQITIKIGEIYKQAKVELGKDATNQKVGEYFSKSEATVRNYIKIADNKEILFETPVSETLSVRNMVAVINAKKGTTHKKTPVKKDELYYVSENKKLKVEKKELERKVSELEKQLKEFDKLKARLASLMGDA